MYEPYGESKRRFSLENIKSKIKEKLEGIGLFKSSETDSAVKPNRYLLIIFSLVVIALFGAALTGYTTYTARITQAESQIMVLERQVNACKENLTTKEGDLATCYANLDSTKKTLSLTQQSLQEETSKLNICMSEKDALTTNLSEREREVAKMQAAYDALKAEKQKLEIDLSVVKSDKNTLECNYAKDKCQQFGGWYTVKDLKITCCVKIEGKYYCGSDLAQTDVSNVKSC